MTERASTVRITAFTRVRILALACLVPAWFGAASEARALSLAKHPALRDFCAEMAERHGFAPGELQKTFRCAALRPEIVQAMERPRELLPWHEYRKAFVTDDRARHGVQFWRQHAADLARAREQYGVAPEIIVAVIGAESRYGRHAGSWPALDALATLAFQYPPRAAYFRKELEEFLLLARETGLDPCQVKGSYTGALGLPQFMPSNYRRLAVDFDGDGSRDLLGNPVDAIGSVAHYLRRHGWEPDAPVMDEARLKGTLYFWVEKLGLKPSLTVRQLAGYGVFPQGRNDPDRRAALVSLEGETGPFYRLGYNNFYVITRYNLSKRYAMAVVELGELIRRHMEENPPS